MIIITRLLGPKLLFCPIFRESSTDLGVNGFDLGRNYDTLGFWNLHSTTSILQAKSQLL